MLGAGPSLYYVSKRYHANKILLLMYKRYLLESLKYLYDAQLCDKYNCNSCSTPKEKFLTEMCDNKLIKYQGV